MSAEIREILEQLETIKESLKDLRNLMEEKCVGDYELTEDVFDSLYDLEYSIRDELEEVEDFDI